MTFNQNLVTFSQNFEADQLSVNVWRLAYPNTFQVLVNCVTKTVESRNSMLW